MKLVIAEKPSVAKEIARVLGAETRQNGFLEGGGYLVTWCIGHLVEAYAPEEYDAAYHTWSAEHLPILPAQFRYKASPDTIAQYHCIHALCERDDVAELVCATDAGREGELIFRLVYQLTGCQKPFTRLWVSSMEPAAIRDGFACAKDGHAYDALYAAAEARSMADWLVGINATRLFSCLFHSKLNIGRVQTPTINMIVRRAAAIAAFVPVPYYILTADTGAFKLTHRFEGKEEATRALEQCTGQPCIVTGLETEEKQEPPPRLFDLTALQREANRMFDFSAQHTLDLAQALYERRLLTYPRTDSNFITEDMYGSFCTLYALLRQSSLVEAQRFPELAAVHPEETVRGVIDNAKVTDHHALLITAAATNVGLEVSGDERALLQLVAYRMLAACHLPQRYAQTNLQAEAAAVIFSGTFKNILQKGYSEITQQLSQLLKGQAPAQSQSLLPPLTLGQTINPVDIRLAEQKTEPPKPYTEDTLLSAMEHAGRQLEASENESLDRATGLGTPATRAGIIERIITTGYVERKSLSKTSAQRKALVPTEKAIRLMPLLPENLTSAELTADFEFSLDEIARGKLPQAAFMGRITEYVRALVADGKTIAVDPALFGNADERESLGACPRCGQPVLEGKLNYYCKSGKGGCGFTLWKNDRFWTDKDKTLGKATVAALLAGKNPLVKGLLSQKTGKLYNAYISLDDTGKYINFKMKFEKK